MYSNILHARHFFVQHVDLQARYEGAPLTRAEQYMLCRGMGGSSECGEPSLEQAFLRQTTHDEFDDWVRGLIVRAYERDLARDSGARALWRKRLKSSCEECFLTRLVREAVGQRLKPRLAGVF